MMKVYVVVGKGVVKGVYTNEETARKVADEETYCAGCEGSNTIYGVRECEVQED